MKKIKVNGEVYLGSIKKTDEGYDISKAARATEPIDESDFESFLITKRKGNLESFSVSGISSNVTVHPLNAEQKRTLKRMKLFMVQAVEESIIALECKRFRAIVGKYQS